VIASVATSEPQFVKELVHLKATEATAGGPQAGNRDDLYDAAVEVVIREGRGSVSLLQRSLGIGYGRAARLIDYMAEDGIVGPYNGSQAREVLITLDDWIGGSEAAATAEAPSPRRSSKILLAAPEPVQDNVPEDDERYDEDDTHEEEMEDEEEEWEYEEGDSFDEEEAEPEDEQDEEDEYDDDEYEEEEYDEEDESGEDEEEFEEEYDEEPETEEVESQRWTAESA
jgi:S-DNA-T family DNA segregation ATPase FtsK/SpoIIIE